MSEKFTFFLKGKLSQWSPSPFIVNRINYTCAEQYMMAEKARLFFDWEMADHIMAANHPREQKALGRQVRNFRQEMWDQYAREIVYVGNWHKFNQHPTHFSVLRETEETLVECNPSDNIWGIGLAEGDPRTLSRETWLGKNWLGEVLTQVRDDLLNDIYRKEFKWTL
jgi:ribA/ribD-fused uncharacterized protein